MNSPISNVKYTRKYPINNTYETIRQPQTEKKRNREVIENTEKKQQNGTHTRMLTINTDIDRPLKYKPIETKETQKTIETSENNNKKENGIVGTIKEKIDPFLSIISSGIGMGKSKSFSKLANSKSSSSISDKKVYFNRKYEVKKENKDSSSKMVNDEEILNNDMLSQNGSISPRQEPGEEISLNQNKDKNDKEISVAPLVKNPSKEIRNDYQNTLFEDTISFNESKMTPCKENKDIIADYYLNPAKHNSDKKPKSEV